VAGLSAAGTGRTSPAASGVPLEDGSRAAWRRAARVVVSGEKLAEEAEVAEAEVLVAAASAAARVAVRARTAHARSRSSGASPLAWNISTGWGVSSGMRASGL